ncbi:unnamed protein product [Phytomonas sp. EM1]|nr:unnamed protein product [Phytomonas sp. EM1]|eukprot:CCW60613.1 unnamed protein product [Phytomonas sp. isolate EM1]
MHIWYVLRSSLKSKVDLQKTLLGGQCFRWFPTAWNSYVGTVHHRVYELRYVMGTTTIEVDFSNSNHHFNALTKGACKIGNEGGWIEYRRLYPLTAQSKSDGRKVKRSTRSSLKKEPSSTPNGKEMMFNDEDEEFLLYYLSLDVDMPALWSRWTSRNPMKDHPLVSYLISSTVGALNSSEPGNSSRDIEKIKKKRAKLSPSADLMPASLDLPVRVLRQDLHETLFSFLCSQNNHIKRITAMVDALCTNYGAYLCSFNTVTGEVCGGKQRPRDASQSSDKDKNRGCWLHLYSFPTIEQLHRASEEQLRELGLGYRSKYIIEASRQIRSAAHTPTPPPSSTKSATLCAVKRESTSKVGVFASHLQTTLDEPFYQRLLSLPECAAQRVELMTLRGVGRKVADCTLLFGVGHMGLVPVDTHMMQIAAEYLAPSEPTLGDETPSWMRVLSEWRLQINQSAKPTGRKRSREEEKQVKNIKTVALLPKHHDAIQEGFQALFGPYSGWAHSALFYVRIQ